MGVPGTLGPKPAGLANGEPAGAMLTGACKPGGPDVRVDRPDGAPANNALAIWAINAGSNGGALDGVAAVGAGGKPKVLTVAYL